MKLIYIAESCADQRGREKSRQPADHVIVTEMGSQLALI
jgi:hypothetical protein